MADKKITDLTELTAVDSEDVLEIVDDPAGTPASKKIKARLLMAASTVRHTGSGSITANQMRGHTHVITSAATITLPAVSAGLHAKFVTIGAIAVSVKAGSSDQITLKNTAIGDGDKVTNGSTDGDMIEIMANAAGTDWETGIWSGTWTDGGA